MKLAVVSDIHGNLPALQAVAAEIDAEGVDAVVNLGDIASGPLWPRQTVAFLIARGWPAIAGNHERQALAAAPSPGPAPASDDGFTAAELGAAERAWLAVLPADLALDAGRVLCVHASPGHDLRPLLETVIPGFGTHGQPGVRAATDEEVRRRLGAAVAPRTQLLLCGHTHLPRLRWLAAADGSGGCLLVNPGSVGRPAFSDDHPHPWVAETGSPHARWALLQRTSDGTAVDGGGDCAAAWRVQLRAIAYDWEASARRAESLGFAAWARQLRTGRA
jgi:predicted phosphodiesterase